MSVISQKIFNSLPQKPKQLKSNTCTVTSAICTDLGPIEQCYLTFKVKNMYFTDKFIVLQDLCRDLKLRLNWQFNYKMCCNWNINGHQYMMHNTTYLCTSIPLKVKHLFFEMQDHFTYNPRVCQSLQSKHQQS